MLGAMPPGEYSGFRAMRDSACDRAGGRAVGRGFARVSLALGVLVVGLAMWCCAGVARASTNVTFDDLAAGAFVGDHYRDAGGADRGVVFGPSPLGIGSEQPVVTVVGSLAHSGSQIGKLSTPRCPTGEACRTPDGFMFFPVEVSSVSLFVGAFGTVADTITVTAFDRNGARIDSPRVVQVTGGAGFSTQVGFAHPSAPIFYVEVRGSTFAGRDRRCHL